MLTRRKLLRNSVMGAAGAYAGRGLLGGTRAASGVQLTEDFDGTTPFNTPPFVEAMPIPPVKAPKYTGADCYMRLTGGLRNPRQPAHQQDSLNVPWGRPQKAYEMRVGYADWSFHPEIPDTRVFGFDGRSPGPTFQARYGEPIIVRIHNDLPANHEGFGIPSISTHLHNAHTASESDGNPDNYFDSGEYWDNHYPNVLSGVMTDGYGYGRETLGTLWYHDHRRDFTAQNVYAGLVGFYLLYDQDDCGEEGNRLGFRLPSGNYDVPMVLADKVFGTDGNLLYNFFNQDGILGDRYTVNGKIQPYFEVARRKYRLRFLDGGPARFYALALSDGSPFIQIGNDGNLFERPIYRKVVWLGVAERADVIVDFSRYRTGTRLYLMNLAEQIDGRGPTGDLLSMASGTKLVEFRVGRREDDKSVIPKMDANVISLREQPPIPPQDVLDQLDSRTFVFDRSGGGWTVNELAYDPNRVLAAPKRGRSEVWTLRNESGGWWHPIHIHNEEFRVISRDGRAPDPWEAGRKDTIALPGNSEVKVLVCFRDWLGKYPVHCHNVLHEDHAMMFRFDVTD